MPVLAWMVVPPAYPCNGFETGALRAPLFTGDYGTRRGRDGDVRHCPERARPLPCVPGRERYALRGAK